MRYKIITTNGGIEMKIGKKQIVLASLVLALGAAVYLNWQFSDTNIVNTGAEQTIGEAQLVSNQSDESAKSETDASKADTGNTDSYFSTARTDRQRAQDEAVDLAKEILESAEGDEAAKAEAVQSAEKIASVYQQQSNIESLLKAKGFSDCVVFIQNGECSVVLKKSEIKEDTNLIVKDIVSGQADIELESIKITGV